MVHCLFWLLLRFSLLSVQALCKAHSKTILEIQRISWEQWIKGHGIRSRWRKLSNHNTDLMLQKAFGVGRGSLQGNSESLGRACRDLLNWRSLALDRKSSSVVPASCPTLAESQLEGAWPPTDHRLRAWRRSPCWLSAFACWRQVLSGPELRAAALRLSYSAGSLKHLHLLLLFSRLLFLLAYNSCMSSNMLQFQPHFLWKLLSTNLSQFLESLWHIHVPHSHSIIHCSQTLFHIYHIFVLH